MRRTQNQAARGTAIGRWGPAWLAAGLLWAPAALFAQASLHVPQGSQVQLQVAQPMVDVSSPVTATAEFDPPAVRVGEKTFYRVTLDATESSADWPDKLPAAAGLKFGAHSSGQITQMQMNKFRPLASFIYEVRPAVEGRLEVSNFAVNVSGTMVEVPAATLEARGQEFRALEPREVVVELSKTNVFLGEPFQARVILPAGPGNEVEALREVEFHGDGVMADKTASHQAIEPVPINGQLKNAYVCEMTLTAIAAGPVKFFAQGFTAGREFTAPISIRGQVSLSGGAPKYKLLVSEAVEIKVRPLPAEGELAGFTGAIGRFFADPPQLSTNRLQAGEPVQLRLGFHGEGDLTRFVPPAAPRLRDWQIIADPPPATSFTLIPLADDVRETPAIPFCYFDPGTGKYVDLTTPPMPVTLTGQSLPVETRAENDEGRTGAALKLGAAATTRGVTVASLKPILLRGWFWAAQLAPGLGFLGLWLWDRRRRFLAAHPEIVRRNEARRALRRERRELQQAMAAGDGPAYARHAARALCIAAAPHFPAHPRALACGDVLAQLPPAAGAVETEAAVKMVFAAANAEYAGDAQPAGDVLALWPKVETVLQTLEERL